MTPTARTRNELEAFLSRREHAGGDLRVTLRPLAPADAAEFTGLVAASADLHQPWMSLPAKVEDYTAWIIRYDHDTAQGLLVCRQDTGAIVGYVAINGIARGRAQFASIAYAAFAPSAGKGYLSAGLRLVIGYAFEQLRLHRLEAQIQPGNTASINLVRRLGFRFEGLAPELLFIDGAWRDHERWALTATMLGIDVPRHPTQPAD